MNKQEDWLVDHSVKHYTEILAAYEQAIQLDPDDLLLADGPSFPP